jgi:hypothetical protein
VDACVRPPWPAQPRVEPSCEQACRESPSGRQLQSRLSDECVRGIEWYWYLARVVTGVVCWRGVWCDVAAKGRRLSARPSRQTLARRQSNERQAGALRDSALGRRSPAKRRGKRPYVLARPHIHMHTTIIALSALTTKRTTKHYLARSKACRLDTRL